MLRALKAHNVPFAFAAAFAAISRHPSPFWQIHRRPLLLCSSRAMLTAPSSSSWDEWRQRVGEYKDETFTTIDGQRVAFLECGDLSGWPVFFIHGWPASRLSSLSGAIAARSQGVRLIAPDRPGVGRSEFAPNRSIDDFPDLIGALARHLGVAEFAVLGISGGGPYVLSCLYHLPASPLRAATFVAGLTGEGEGTHTHKAVILAVTCVGLSCRSLPASSIDRGTFRNLPFATRWQYWALKNLPWGVRVSFAVTNALMKAAASSPSTALRLFTSFFGA
mmetsp:Transcript_27542/g.79253  ORF Transcript_27542/g.79253 Transcript_27542/m.79253 type:complete len:277 (-) Transcript_27542:926-1756(-)